MAPLQQSINQQSVNRLIRKWQNAFQYKHKYSTTLEGAHESAYLRQALAFNAEKFRGHVTLATPPFGKIFWGHVRTVPENTCAKFEVRSFNRF